MSNPKRSRDTHSTISLQESGDGRSQLDWLASQIPSESSPEAHPASHSAQPGEAVGTATNDILHPTGSGWSQPSGLLGSLASRWQPQYEKTTGSMIYLMHWKEKATPRGRAYFQLVASGRRISDRDFGLWHGWPTPMANNANKDCNRYRENNSNGLGAIASLCGGWATPTTRDHKNTGDLETYIYGSPTGRIRDDSTSTQA